MEENLVGYLLDCLDDESKSKVEALLQASPEARQKLVGLRRALEPLAVDKDTIAAPPDLVVRTLTRVAEHICANGDGDLPRAPIFRFESATSTRRWWRRADVLIAACLLLTVVGGILPAMLRMKTNSAVIACQNNLRQFYVALQTYRDQHSEHSYPDLDKLPEPRKVAGMVVPILNDAGVLPQTASIRCPANGCAIACQMTLAELRAMSDEDFQVHAPQLSLSYAYSLGYRDEAGNYHSPGPHPQLASSLIALMGDRVVAEDPLVNSSNHGGTGQNILYSDGHVRFSPARVVAGDDLYLNLRNEVAAGLGAGDAVLGASASRP